MGPGAPGLSGPEEGPSPTGRRVAGPSGGTGGGRIPPAAGGGGAALVYRFRPCDTAPADAAFGLAAFALLAIWRLPPWLVVLLTAAGGLGLSLIAGLGGAAGGAGSGILCPP
jgi:hypothetical protein